MLTTPVVETGASSASSLSPWSSPLCRRVGFHNFPFEASSSFTHVTACQIAHPPDVGFVSSLQSGRLPFQTARQLPSPADGCSGGSFPAGDLRPWGTLHSSGYSKPQVWLDGRRDGRRDGIGLRVERPSNAKSRSPFQGCGSLRLSYRRNYISFTPSTNAFSLREREGSITQELRSVRPSAAITILAVISLLPKSIACAQASDKTSIVLNV